MKQVLVLPFGQYDLNNILEITYYKNQPVGKEFLNPRREAFIVDF